MGTITANTTRTLDGHTNFSIAGEAYTWDTDYLDFFVDGSAYTMTYNISGSAWGVNSMTFGGTSKLVINDSSTGDDRFISFIELANAGNNTVNLAKTSFDLLKGSSGVDKVTLGSVYVGKIALGDGNDILTTGTSGVHQIDMGDGNNTVNVIEGIEVGSLMTGGGIDRITLTGITEVANISAGWGNDVITTSTGWVGYLDAGRGLDTVTLGSGGADFVALGRDADTVKLSRLSDASQAVSLNGGANVSTSADRDSDTVDFSAFTKALKLSLGEPSLVNTGNGFFLISEFENAFGGQGNDKLLGDDQANIFKGNAGNDAIAGGLGIDTLTGGSGSDIFVFDTKPSATVNVDKITDFNVSADTIHIDNGVYTKLSGIGVLTSGQFHQSSSGLAHDSSDRIIYDIDTGKVFYDADGNDSGTAVQFALLAKSLALTSSDFYIV